MSKKPENQFIDRVHNRLPIKKRKASTRAREKFPVRLHVHAEKMNNPMRSGTPDCWYSGPGGSLWVEYKYLATMPVRREVKPKELLSPLQLDWINERFKEGQRVAVAIGCPDGVVVLKDDWWNADSLSSEQFKKLLSPIQDFADWIMGEIT